MTFDAYEIYCDSCHRFGRKPPTREEFENGGIGSERKPFVPTLVMAKVIPLRSQIKSQAEINFDYETERREGWAHE